jgi:uncharacterized protein YjiS (DUF1127 family)
MFDINLPSNDLTPYLRRARLERAEATAGILSAGIAAIGKGFAALAAARDRRRIRRQTVRELNALPDRALQDIGLSRSQIWSVADDLVNGAARNETPKAAPRHHRAANQNQRNSQAHLPLPAVAGCQ